MKAALKLFLSCLVLALVIISCQKQAKQPATSTTNGVSADVLQKISSQGFSTDNVRKQDGGYLVEGDILMTDESLNQVITSPDLLIANVEQYNTYNLVTSLPRTITVSMSNLPQAYSDGLDIAISRYNAQSLQLSFQRLGSGGDIQIIGFNQGPSGGYITLGSSGFPSGGNPYNQIKLNTNSQAYGSNPDINYMGSIIAHEMGHCIGFRHTDYKNRSYSCGGAKTNEGAGTIGAIHIPGTPTGPRDPGSWMLSCANGTNRPFNANDIVALNYLY